jgi:hypothetical protein
MSGPVDKVSVAKKVGLAVVELVISSGLSYKALPFPAVSGYEIIFIGVALFGTLVGAVLALRFSFGVGNVVAAIGVAAVMSLAYSTIISGSGVSPWWTSFALAVYFGIFASVAYAFSALAQELLKHL